MKYTTKKPTERNDTPPPPLLNYDITKSGTKRRDS